MEKIVLDQHVDIWLTKVPVSFHEIDFYESLIQQNYPLSCKKSGLKKAKIRVEMSERRTKWMEKDLQ